MEKGTVVRVERDVDFLRRSEGTDGAQRRALLLLLLEATK